MLVTTLCHCGGSKMNATLRRYPPMAGGSFLGGAGGGSGPPPGPSRRQHGVTHAGVVGSITIVFNEAAVAGNLIVIAVACVGGSVDVTSPPAGYVTLGDTPWNSGTGHALILYKVAAGGESSVTISGNGSPAGGWEAGYVEYAGLKTSSVADAYVGTAGTGSPVTSGATGMLAQAVEVGFGALMGGTSFTGSPTGGFSQIDNEDSQFNFSTFDQLTSSSASLTLSQAVSVPGTNCGVLGTFELL